VAGDAFFIATAKNLSGPWNTSAGINATVNQPPHAPADYWATHKSNPAPFIFRNGSVLALFRCVACSIAGNGAAPRSRGETKLNDECAQRAQRKPPGRTILAKPTRKLGNVVLVVPRPH
jgi:hypothetical protein